jgi:hypothetical protein
MQLHQAERIFLDFITENEWQNYILLQRYYAKIQ